MKSTIADTTWTMNSMKKCVEKCTARREVLDIVKYAFKIYFKIDSYISHTLAWIAVCTVLRTKPEIGSIYTKRANIMKIKPDKIRRHLHGAQLEGGHKGRTGVFVVRSYLQLSDFVVSCL